MKLEREKIYGLLAPSLYMYSLKSLLSSDRHAWLLTPGCVGVSFSRSGPAGSGVGPPLTSPATSPASRVLRLSVSAQQKRTIQQPEKKSGNRMPAAGRPSSPPGGATTGGKMTHSRRPLTRSVLRASLSPLSGNGGPSITGSQVVGSSPVSLVKKTAGSPSKHVHVHYLHPRRIPSPK